MKETLIRKTSEDTDHILTYENGGRRWFVALLRWTGKRGAWPQWLHRPRSSIHESGRTVHEHVT